MSVNPDLPLPSIWPWIQYDNDPQRKKHPRTDYVCQSCNERYSNYRCKDIPNNSKERMSWARKEVEFWINKERPENSEWYFSRRLLLWVLHKRKLESYLVEHQWCEPHQEESPSRLFRCES